MKNELLKKLMKSGTIKEADILEVSKFFDRRDVPTNLPILNIGFSANPFVGYQSGLTIFAGQSKTFKTLLSIYCLKSYFDLYPEAVCLYYDSEFGASKQYFKRFGVDTEKVIHVPIVNIQQLNFDLNNRLNSIERGDKAFILIDSIGNLASKREADNALNENEAKDMSRAQDLKSFFRVVTPQISFKDIPCFAINHTYKTMELYAKTVVSGGQGPELSSSNILVITKSQEKEATTKELEGWNFNIEVFKSRSIREKSKFSILVTYKDGIYKWSGIFELALEAGIITETKKGYYSFVDLETGEVENENGIRKKKIEEDDAFMNKIVNDKNFIKFLHNRFSLDGITMQKETSEEIKELMQGEDDDEE